MCMMLLTSFAGIYCSGCSVVCGCASKRVRKDYNRPQCMVLSYVNNSDWWDGPVFKERMRMSYPSFRELCDYVQPSFGDLLNGISGIVRTTEFKVVTTLYYLGHCISWKVCADVAGIGASTVLIYVRDFVAALMKHLKPAYMPGMTTHDWQTWIRAKFAERRGIRSVCCTVDRTHVPWVPDKLLFVRTTTITRDFIHCHV